MNFSKKDLALYIIDELKKQGLLNENIHAHAVGVAKGHGGNAALNYLSSHGIQVDTEGDSIKVEISVPTSIKDDKPEQYKSVW